ncbi:hypothetical protein ACJX0J_034651, partial [Zea mays]
MSFGQLNINIIKGLINLLNYFITCLNEGQKCLLWSERHEYEHACLDKYQSIYAIKGAWIWVWIPFGIRFLAYWLKWFPQVIPFHINNLLFETVKPSINIFYGGNFSTCFKHIMLEFTTIDPDKRLFPPLPLH